MRMYGYECGNKLLIEIDDVDVVLTLDEKTKKFASISKYDKVNMNECKEVTIDLDEVYSTKIYPRIYCSIYKIKFDNIESYVLEQYDGTSATTKYMICDRQDECERVMGEL